MATLVNSTPEFSLPSRWAATSLAKLASPEMQAVTNWVHHYTWAVTKTLEIFIWVSDKIRYVQSSIERVVGLPSLQNR